MHRFVGMVLVVAFVGCSESEPSKNGAGDGDTSTCTDALTPLLAPVDTVSDGAVTVLSESDGTKIIYVDASAGGTSGEASNPRVYVNLERAERVDVSDKAAAESTDWDLAFKRPLIFTNGGDGGPGDGGALLAEKDFDAVTSDDVSSSSIPAESFVDEQCTPKVDGRGTVKTSFDGWYDYDPASHGVSPRKGVTWLVKGGTGKTYKVRIDAYNATPEGGSGEVTGRYIIAVGAL